MTKYKTTILVALLCVLTLSACAMAGNPTYTEQAPAGFWQGWWHGVTSWIALIWHLFDPSVKVYEVANNGGWYDWGFLIGAGSCGGGATSAGSRSRRRSRDE